MFVKTTQTIEPTETEPRWFKGTLISMPDARGKQMIADGLAEAAVAPPCEDGSDKPALAAAPKTSQPSALRADRE